MRDVIVIGAGVAGLRCARGLAARGADVLLLDRADKVGGRCATRSFAGGPADYGPLFFHGSDPEFLSAVRSTQGVRVLEGWPRRIEGQGHPCQPLAFAAGESRLAFEEGMNAFARGMGEGLEVRLRTQVAAVSACAGSVQVVDSTGARFEARHLVLAMALEQSLPFLQGLDPDAGIDAARTMLAMFFTVPCLTVVAGYEHEQPPWDIMYPENDDVLLLIGNESAKRPSAGSLTLAVQAAPRWSRAMLERPKEEWARELLGNAARRLGTWASAPKWTHPHRWRQARLDGASELAHPLLLSVRGSRIGICGELFAPGGGMQAAWRSGGLLAARLAE